MNAQMTDACENILGFLDNAGLELKKFNASLDALLDNPFIASAHPRVLESRRCADEALTAAETSRTHFIAFLNNASVTDEHLTVEEQRT